MGICTVGGLMNSFKELIATNKLSANTQVAFMDPSGFFHNPGRFVVADMMNKDGIMNLLVLHPDELSLTEVEKALGYKSNCTPDQE